MRFNYQKRPTSFSPVTFNTIIQTSQVKKDKSNIPKSQPTGTSLLDYSISRMAIISVQPKLTIGQPGDKYEQEADQVASQVVNQINAPDLVPSKQSQSIQGRENPEDSLQTKLGISPQLRAKLFPTVQLVQMPEEEELQMKPTPQHQKAIEGGTTSIDLESTINSARGSGQPLDAGLQSSMGQAFGTDFSRVKVHTDTQSDQLNQSIQARAFTTGQDVFFRQGEYKPGSRGGQELIAHELTHVVQQTGDREVVQRSFPNELLVDAPANETAPTQNQVPTSSLLDTANPQESDNSPALDPKWAGSKYKTMARIGKEFRNEELDNDRETAKMFKDAGVWNGTDPKNMDFAGPQFLKTSGEIVKHVQDNELEQYEITSQSEEKEETNETVFYWRGKLLDTTHTAENPGYKTRTGVFIFAMTADGKIYTADPEKEAQESGNEFDRFHHSSFLRGAPVVAAGELVFENGVLKTVTNQSGHYQPGFEHIIQVLQEFSDRGVSLTGVKLELTYPNPENNNVETTEIEADEVLKTGARTLDALIKAYQDNNKNLKPEKKEKKSTGLGYMEDIE
jgi:Domain of unknown function (DUF4157)